MYDALGNLIWAITWGAEAGWAWRVQKLGLRRRYPALFTYLVFSAAHSVSSTVVIGFWGLKRGSEIYYWFWAITYPILWLLMLCLVLEAYGRILKASQEQRRKTRLLGVLGLGMVWAFAKGASWTPHDQEIIIYGVLAAVALVSLTRVRDPHGVWQNPVAVLGLFASLFLFEVAVLSLPHGSIELTMRYTALPVFYTGLVMRGAWTFHQES